MKTFRCLNCSKVYHYLGIARHRAMHRDKKEDVTIKKYNGEIHTYHFSTPIYLRKDTP